MFHELPKAGHGRERGFALATAIFILVILAALAAFLLSVSNLEQGRGVLDVQGTKAYRAARAGVEWGAYRVLRDSSCAGSTSFVLPGGLSEFTVTVQCTGTAYTEAGSSGDVYSITATACNQPSGASCPGLQGANYVERQLQATIDKRGP
jgi:MSHA biogenesis protein MshP